MRVALLAPPRRSAIHRCGQARSDGSARIRQGRRTIDDGRPVDLEDLVEFLTELLDILPEDAPGFTISFESPDSSPEASQLLDETWARIKAGEFWDRDPG